MEHVNDKVIVITGAASGFGKLVCEKAGAMGAHLVCGDINGEGLDATISELTTAGRSALGRITDVTNLDDMKALVEKATAEHGRVDVMINNAGVMPLAFYADHESAVNAWSTCIDVNIKGVLNGIIATYDQMMRQGRGHVINLSSIYGNFPVVGAGVYGATKAAVNFLSESLRVESAGKIKVTIVKPTGVPGTNLGAGVINSEAIVGILGQNAGTYFEKVQALTAGNGEPGQGNPNSPAYLALEPEYIADAIISTINQPWGVATGDITIRATGDGYIL